MINVAHDTKMMYGRTLHARSFMKWRGSREEHEEHEGKTRGETREELVKQTRFDYTCARSSKDKEIHDPRSTRDDTSSKFSLRRS